MTEDAKEPIVEETPAEVEVEVADSVDVDGEVRRLSRRGFITFGAAAAAGIGAYEWLRSRPRIEGVEWPLRRVLEGNERLAKAYFSRHRLNPTYSPSRIKRPARINGGVGLDANFDMASWKLDVNGTQLTLDDIRKLPKRTMITEFRCIEGWSTINQWTGVRLADLMAKFPPPSPVRYAALETPGRGYYVGLDIDSAMHPQTLLAWALNGAPLTSIHGAPLRLAIPIKYGVKNIKRIATVRWTNVRPPDFWAERGYDWYCGH